MFATDRRTFLAGGLAATALPLRAAPPPLFEPRAIAGDLDILSAAYRELHPGLDRYLGRAAFAARIAALKAWAERPRPPGAVFVELGRLTAAVRCGHSYPNPVNQSEAILQGLLDGRDRVPFTFKWIGSQMAVTRSLRGDLALAPGTIIDRIDGVRASDLLRQLLPLARADGSNDGKRRALMAVDGTGRYNAFDVYSALLRPARGDGAVALSIGGRERLVPAMTDAERQKLGTGDGQIDGGWRFAIDPDGIGLLAMPTWALYNSKWDWRGFIDRAVDQLIDGKARGLIVDLRDNEGGLDCGDVLLERLIDRPLVQPAFQRLVRYRRVPAALNPYLDTWDKSFRDWGDKARPADRSGYFRLVRDSDDEQGASIKPRGRRFTGPVAVLVSPTCSSATFQFAAMVKGGGRVRLLGETTGGNRRGINGGAYFFLRLPGTGMEVDLPLIGYFPHTDQPDAGVEPDLAVAVRREDIAKGVDRAMVAARAALT
jgi:hypothetical protein